MAPHITGDKDRVTGLCLCAAGFHAGEDFAHTGGGNEHTIYLSLACHLGIAGYDLHTSLLGGFLHGSRNLLQLVHGEALFNHKRTGEVSGLCTHTGKIVDGAADGQLADISARKKRRRDNKAVCGHCHFSLGRLQHCRIVCGKAGICKMFLKHSVNELRRLGAPCAMRQSYCFLCHHRLSYSIPY